MAFLLHADHVLCYDFGVCYYEFTSGVHELCKQRGVLGRDIEVARGILIDT